MDEKITSLTELPLDILVLVFPYLDAKSFLALCGTCKAFHQDSIRLDSAYWAHQTRSTFRVPNQPVVQSDGARWQKLYRRLLTQSRVYTWGSNSNHRLGHSYDPVFAPGHHIGGMRLAHRRGQVRSYTPKEMDNTRELGIIADLQCGHVHSCGEEGWSTTVLTSNGTLHTAGVLNGEHWTGEDGRLQALSFPAIYANDVAHHEPTIAIRQFSAGRSHILALSDSGRIWAWSDASQPAMHIKFVNVDLAEVRKSSNRSSTNEESNYGHVRQVVAGWSCSSAYIHGTGIVLWGPVRSAYDGETDTMLVYENFEIPRTGYQRARGATRESDEDRILGQEVGVVMNYIILENFVVFVTDIGKVFCARLEESNTTEDILELRALENQDGNALDVQGSFRRFAVFKGGEVIIVHQDYLDECWDARITNPEQTGIQGLKKIPALQHNGVISVAFGDYHFHALHSSGKITSYGNELQSCGALGLGGDGGPTGRLRGFDFQGQLRTSSLVPHAYTHGRQIWFRPEQNMWLKVMDQGGKDYEEVKERKELFNADRNVQGEVSEWVEQEGRAWDKEKGEDGLGAFFALRVSAAGWHSGAVVLVNEDLERRDVYDWENSTFPRLKLSDGTEMPGSKDFDEWREGIPNWELDVEV
ncbi:RCC1/BLIP-II [Periconia macrospinosa]|uniref:RCC1/BLIP-II n=1 Tax=Periconia macrospinosa TaxID=97972 RepID=A0A2V1DMY1_9PLEO|nr:RCC1/BLIP-II [Periconia macrospinosa]